MALGYLPKHIKVKRFRRTMRLIAMAALAGCVYERRATRAWIERHKLGVQDWGIIYPDGQESASYPSKSQCARRFLRWFLGRHDAAQFVDIESRDQGGARTGRLFNPMNIQWGSRVLKKESIFNVSTS